VNTTPAQDNNRKRLLKTVFSLNIGFAITYALFAYDGSSYIATNAPNGVQNVLEAFGNVLRRVAPLVVHMRTKSEHLRSEIVREGLFLALVLVVALVVYSLVLLLGRTSAGQLLLAPVSAITTLIAVPGCWLYIVHATWRGSEPRTFWASYGYAFILEAAVASGLVYLFRNQSNWRGTLVFALHYIFRVGLVLWDRDWLAPVAISIPLSLVFPCSGFAWLRYAQAVVAHTSCLFQRQLCLSAACGKV
jgi:hypothetical protein